MVERVVTFYRLQEKHSGTDEKHRLRCHCQVGVAFLVTAILVAANLLGDSAREQTPVARPMVRVVDVTLERGETLHGVLSRFALDAESSHAIIETFRPFVNPRTMRARQSLQVILDPQGNRVKGLEYPLSSAVVRVELGPAGWSAERKEIPSVRETRVVRGILFKSLYQDGTAAGLTPAQILDLSDIFQYDIDFFSDFHRGDTFSVAFEEIRYADGRREPGRILAVELTVGGDPVHAFRHITHGGKGVYYDIEGQSLRSAFLRAPLNYRRISSHYSLNRRHPIFRTVRPHRAIDYAAAAGTPVVSIGRGTVNFVGWRDGYGNLVEIRHPNGYTTRYAHFSRIAPGLRKGTRVAQGRVIGYVGQTGHATGPHLHFEMLRGRSKINFLALRIPRQQRLAGEELVRFTASRDEHLVLLRDQEIRIASSRH
ncbi:MAG: peptidoglycan DD-metalloendopeptidase family protein [Candidatus Binatia bacterium]